MTAKSLPAWRYAEDLAREYAVTPATLELYRARGTLASTTRAGGRLFDATSVARLFRRRAESGTAVSGGSYGALGSVVLGVPPVAGRDALRAASASSRHRPARTPHGVAWQEQETQEASSPADTRRTA